MKVTESMHLERTRLAVDQLRRLLTAGVGGMVYRLAVARKFSLAYYAFMSYLIERMNVNQETAESLTMEDILLRCRYMKLFTSHQEQYVMKMGMIYAAVSCYEHEYYTVTDELLKDIPQLAEFLSHYCTLRSTVALPHGGKVVRRVYEQSV